MLAGNSSQRRSIFFAQWLGFVFRFAIIGASTIHNCPTKHQYCEVSACVLQQRDTYRARINSNLMCQLGWKWSSLVASMIFIIFSPQEMKISRHVANCILSNPSKLQAPAYRRSKDSFPTLLLKLSSTILV